MSAKWIKSSGRCPGAAIRRGRRRGTTLIEAIVGLVILGTLLAALLIARGRFLRQWADAERRLETAQAVDALLSAWMGGGRLDSRSVPVPSQGTLPGAKQRIWRTRWLREQSAQHVEAVVARLEVYDRSPAGQGEGSAPVMTLDFLVHDTSNDPPPVVPPGAPAGSTPGPAAAPAGAPLNVAPGRTGGIR